MMIIAAAIWYGVGVYSHVHWWRNKHDYYASDVILSLVSGLLGPINWIVGWVVLGDHAEGPILLRRHRTPQENADG